MGFGGLGAAIEVARSGGRRAWWLKLRRVGLGLVSIFEELWRFASFKFCFLIFRSEDAGFRAARVEKHRGVPWNFVFFLLACSC
mmetsp:Transcript_26536/g.68518  ORF Transcript_26536/g.68518 Transcript_26536/m.68518 type:complete len:84 (+) Transcript_26536:479-730(+)